MKHRCNDYWLYPMLVAGSYALLSQRGNISAAALASSCCLSAFRFSFRP